MIQEIKKYIDSMTLEEKATLLSGADDWHTVTIDRLGLPDIMVADGPHGLRKEVIINGVKETLKSTCFPTAVTVASSFDVELLAEMGKAIATECIASGVDVILGPGINMKRSPLCGRNFEYYSEDPYVAGNLAAAYINGVQSTGIGTSLKHFAANNQEAGRMVVSAMIDERTLREIYLRAFEIAVKKSQPYTIMSSYNRINNEYTGESKRIVNDILREEWGYKGLIVSDWTAVDDRIKGVKAGLDLEMPCSKGNGKKKIIEAVEAGLLSIAELDRCVERVIELVLKCKSGKVIETQLDYKKQHSIARKLINQSAVLLKNNDNILPLTKKEKVLVIGSLAEHSRYQGSGSSRINTNNLVSFIDCVKSINQPYQYLKGYTIRGNGYSKKLIKEAVNAAAVYDKLILFVGLTDEYESEGSDRGNLRLPSGQLRLIEELIKVNKNIIIVTQCGSPIEMSFHNDVKAILNLYLGGEAVGEGAYDILFGDVNPSGKLAETFPMKLEDHVNHKYYPMGHKYVEYREGIFIGYRYYDTANKEVLYPFGHGLSYTSFSYSDLKISSNSITDKDTLTVDVKVKNTGNREGREVIQLYVKDIESTIFKASKELKGFSKVNLLAGEEKVIQFTLDKEAFHYYNVNINDWDIESGDYEIMIGSSSRDIHLSAVVNVKSSNDNISSNYRESAPIFYNLGVATEIPKEQFEGIYNGELVDNYTNKKGSFDRNSTISDFKDGFIGKVALLIIKLVEKYKGFGSDKESLNTRIKTSIEVPVLRNSYQLGVINEEQMEALLMILNGPFFKGLRKYRKAKKGRKKTR